MIENLTLKQLKDPDYGLIIMEKLNDVINEVNRLGKEPAPHAHREIGGGPAIGAYDKFAL